jgi:hypothetical protein
MFMRCCLAVLMCLDVVVSGFSRSLASLSSGLCGPRKARRSKYAIAVLIMAAMLFAQSAPAFAYLKFGVQASGGPVPLKWTRTPIRRAFSTWQAVPTASIAYQFVGFTAALPSQEDGQSTLGFASRPELDRVLGATDILVDNATGEIVEADIFFNTAFPWSVAAAGETGKFDLESIALHEIGHLSGLGHSALGETELRPDGGRRVLAAEAVMFPIAYPAGNISARTLRADDVAGISDLYPDGGFSTTTGSVSGHVMHNGVGVFGAHVVAFDPAGGSLIGSLSLDDQGSFSMLGLSPGPHVIRVEPLDDADLESFFNSSMTVDLDFRATFVTRLVVVPQGGDSGSVEIAVAGK